MPWWVDVLIALAVTCAIAYVCFFVFVVGFVVTLFRKFWREF